MEADTDETATRNEVVQLVGRVDALQAKLERQSSGDVVRAWDQISNVRPLPAGTTVKTGPLWPSGSFWDEQAKARLTNETRLWPGPAPGLNALNMLMGLSPEAPIGV